jgi:purine-binding chemotaxis protein CheW
MDILSIRKKKSADQPPAATASTAVTGPSTTPTTSTTPKAAPKAKTVPPQAAFASAAPMTPQRPERRAPPTGPDPLEGFLARFDDEGDATEQPAQRMVEAHDDTERYLAFELCGEAYAASIMDVREILTIRSLTEVPRAPREVLGVVSKRGLVLPVIDLATTLGLREPQRRLRTSQRVLVVGEGDRVCGLRVDAVAEVVKMSASNVEAVPPSLGSRNAGLLLGLGRVGQTMYILLDLAAVLDAFAISVGLAPTRTEVV